MVRNYKKKEQGGRTNYSKDPHMVAAYNAVMAGEMTAYAAAKKFGINQKALWLRTSGQIPINAHQGRSTDLPTAVEREIAECILVMADWGWGFSTTEVRDIIQDFVKAKDITTQFADGRPGSDWMGNFLKRHPQISRRTTEHLSHGRREAENPEIVNHWFTLLDDQLQKAGVKDLPNQIYNADETGFVTDPKSDVVLARRGSRRVNQTIGGSGKEQVTVNCAGSAAGKVLPPYVIYKGKNLYHDWVTGGPDGTLYNTSVNGWMESEHFLEWFREQFLTQTAQFSNLPRVLIFDGHLSHLSVEIVRCALENNTVLLRLPAKLTHLLQPFDRTVFRPVKQQWQLLLKQHARTHRGPVSKALFPKLLKELYANSFSANTIQSGFRATGICPFDQNAVQLDLANPLPLVSPSEPRLSTSSAVEPRPSTPSAVEPRPSTPSAVEPQPSTPSAVEPRPSTPEPRPSTPEPRPSTSEPRPSTSEPRPSTSEPRPSTPSAVEPRPSTPSAVEPRPSTPSAVEPRPSTSEPQPSTSSAGEASTRSNSSGRSTPSSVSQEDVSIRDFFLQRMALSHFTPRGRSARVERFRYGEALTEDQCLVRLQEEETVRQQRGRGKGKGRARGRGRGSGTSVSRRRSRSPLRSDEDKCLRCGRWEGDDWIACDICDAWYHKECVNLELPLEDMEDEEWHCDFCSQ